MWQPLGAPPQVGETEGSRGRGLGPTWPPWAVWGAMSTLAEERGELSRSERPHPA